MLCPWVLMMASAAERPAPTIRTGSELEVRPPDRTASSSELREWNTKGRCSPGISRFLGFVVIPGRYGINQTHTNQQYTQGRYGMLLVDLTYTQTHSHSRHSTDRHAHVVTLTGKIGNKADIMKRGRQL